MWFQGHFFAFLTPYFEKSVEQFWIVKAYNLF